MDYENNEYEYEDNNYLKIIISKKNFYCLNCNKRGHYYKECREPIISNGIIPIYIENFDSNNLEKLELYLLKNMKNFNKKLNDNLIIDEEINNKIKFLMVQRKNSLGYLEFMRGRYNLNNINTIEYLLEQMTPEELIDIQNKEFDFLWNNLWDINNIKNKYHHKEYTVSKQKFYELKLNNNNILKKTKTLYKYNEWGFPKGRREMHESDLVCAIREFEEETNYTENMYNVFENCKPIRENLVGTNGINYAHNYFIALVSQNKKLVENNREIGDIKLMPINECLSVIRPYHTNKICIIKYIYSIISSFLKEHDISN